MRAPGYPHHWPKSLGSSALGTPDRLLSEQAHWVNRQHFCDPLQTPERQVALAAFKAAHVGSVHTHDIGEVLLREPSRPAVGAEVPSHRLLEIPFRHSIELFRGAT